jgi:hypothetical protein
MRGDRHYTKLQNYAVTFIRSAQQVPSGGITVALHVTPV